MPAQARERMLIARVRAAGAASTIGRGMVRIGLVWLVTAVLTLAAVAPDAARAPIRDDAEAGPTDAAEPRGDEPLAPLDDGGSAPAPPTASTQAACAAGHVALTFDDGPGRGTGVVLDALAASKVHATFFMVGGAAERSPSLVARTVRDGHRVANHTFGHERLTALSDAGIRATVTRADTALRRAGARPLTLVRPPYGATSARVRSALARVGYGHILWTVDPRDWDAPSTDLIVARTVAGLRPGAVVLLHDGSPYASRSAAAIPRIVAAARSRGYCFGLLDAGGHVVPDAPPAPVRVAPPVQLDDLAGADRVATAVAVAQAGWPDGAPAAVVASADRFADPLAATGLAGTLGGPLLLSSRATLDRRVVDELARLGVGHVALVGEFAPEAVATLRDRVAEVTTVRGHDALDTSVRVAREIAAHGGTTRTAYVASAHDFPDALSVGALAAERRRPVLLTRGVDDRRRLVVAADELGVAETFVIGGPAAVPDAAVAGLGTVHRLAGGNRAATALAIARRTAALGWDHRPLVASGTAFPDGLSGGVLGARLRRPVLLTARDRLSPEVHAWVRERRPAEAVVLGGRAAVGDGPRCQLRTGMNQPAGC